ncbi:bifunctional UDP-N-acetylglucosamine pyrophosphorylase / Glucosamine-1-phosphate N-acetyltransferase [Ketogulonicigenium robustum]|uniref:Bifunctional protein GlmU n=1 Tax=Ketogulonicigenium robustum TaxID=92947 RepID=A0A1W6P151_9RHOB|nr:bifunctional UDP-N-acetylglucosamine diphosphorylase/glucosamine-1-phosphate N-acetyltransferase GlmU [Ketogulonicigenium robustum]ARO15235.1 bifunctional UDP-N-acetylglucosamine pyrophosphorylase / Glucosamine-1-phosphate N-acetyltransferase [Ketogulonicigenium robustum]
MPTHFIILAAGKGTRMESDLPKVLHEVGGAPLIAHALRAADSLIPERVIVVTGYGGDAVAAAALRWNPEAIIARQDEQLGTGHAAQMALPALGGAAGDVFVTFGDTPFIRTATLEAMQAARAAHDIVVLGFEAADPDARYGRLVTDGDSLNAIVEYKDADAATRAIRLCNSGVMCLSARKLPDLLAQLTNDNAAGEFYLTDIVAIARAAGLTAGVVTCPEEETLGINSRAELAAAEAIFQRRARADAVEDGVQLIAPDTVHFAFDTLLGRDAVIEPYVVFATGVTVESGARIRAFSHLEGAHVSRGAIVGPYARLRPGAELAEDVHVGNFVEIKNATIGEGSKANHLTYIGDADVGSGTNIGAGTITVNYDGVFKHRTTIGNRAFIGSHSTLIAPVTVADEGFTAAGSVITHDVAAGSMAIGRARQVDKPGFARSLMARLRAKKDAK